jgi:hypothetical protein
MENIEFSPEVREAWATLAKDPNKRQELAEIITEFIQPNHLTNTYMRLLLNTRQLNSGDLLVKKMRKGLHVHTLVPGSVHLAHEITTSDRVNFILDGANVKVTFNQWEMERGDIGTLADIRAEMRAKLQDYYFNKVFTALSNIWTPGNTPNNFVNLGTDITLAALRDGINEVNYRGGGAKLIVGTRRALQPITEFTNFTAAGTSDDIINELHNTGFVGKIMGVPILGLDQIFDDPENYQPLLPENKILIIGNRVGDFITYGDVRTKAWTDMNPTPPQEFIEIYQQFGMIIDNAQGIYVIQVANPS